MSVEEKWIWNPDTPASVPAGARISAGKSGSVLMSLPTSADVSVNCVPANCMPSPLSPAKRTVTDGSATTGFGWPLVPLSFESPDRGSTDRSGAALMDLAGSLTQLEALTIAVLRCDDNHRPHLFMSPRITLTW